MYPESKCSFLEKFVHIQVLCPVGVVNILKVFHKPRFACISNVYITTIFF